MSLNFKKVGFKLFLFFYVTKSALFFNFQTLNPMLSPEEEKKEEEAKDDFDYVKFTNMLFQLSIEDFKSIADSYVLFPKISEKLIKIIKDEEMRRKDRPPTPKPVRFHRKTPYPLKIPEAHSSSNLVVPIPPPFHRNKKVFPSGSQSNLGNSKLTSTIIRDTSFGRRERSWAVLEDHASPTTASTGQPSFTEVSQHNQSSTTVTTLQPAESVFCEDYFDDAVSDAGVEELDLTVDDKKEEPEPQPSASPPKAQDSNAKKYELPPTLSLPKRKKPELLISIPAQIVYGIGTLGAVTALAINSTKDQLNRSKNKNEREKNRRTKRVLIIIGLLSFCALIGSIISNQSN